MILGVSGVDIARIRVPRFVRVAAYPSVDALAVGLVAGTCDWVGVERANDAESLAAVSVVICASAVVLGSARSLGYRIHASHSLVSAGRSDSVQLSGIRFLWLGAWAGWVEASSRGDRRPPGPGLIRTIFLQALSTSTVPQLARSIGICERTLRRRLTAVHMRSPKQLHAGARAFQIWERVRLRRQTLEAIAHDLGWSGLSAMNRAVHAFLGIRAHEVEQLHPDELARRIGSRLRAPSVVGDERRMQHE